MYLMIPIRIILPNSWSLTIFRWKWNLIADGNGSFPVVMVGGVLEANRSWDIGKEVINCIHKHYPGAYPVRPEVRIPPFHLHEIIAQ